MARVMAGRTLEEVAAHLGLSFQQVMKYEQAANRMSIGTLAEICDYLDVDLRSVLEGAQKARQGSAPIHPALALPPHVVALAGKIAALDGIVFEMVRAAVDAMAKAAKAGRPG